MIPSIPNQDLNDLVGVKLPRGLFARVIKRLGFEKQLKVVKNHLEFFVASFIIFLILSFFAFIGFKQVIANSGFGPFMHLAVSDPGIVLKNWQSFALIVFESMPGAIFVALLLSIAFLLLFVKLVGVTFEKLSLLIKSINKQKHAK